jgi:hypothetical protein
MKLRRTGLILCAVNVVAILTVAAVEFFSLTGGNASGGWLLIFPVFWNLPASLAVFPLSAMKLPDGVLLTALVFAGAFQWYWIGHGIEAFIRKIQSRKSVVEN